MEGLHGYRPWDYLGIIFCQHNGLSHSAALVKVSTISAEGGVSTRFEDRYPPPCPRRHVQGPALTRGSLNTSVPDARPSLRPGFG